MARTKIRIEYTRDFDSTQRIISGILVSEGYKEINRNNETVWKKGVGFWTAMQFIKVEYGSDWLDIYGWVQTGLGNIGDGEMALNGFVAVIPKKSVLKVITKIQDALR
ncbi:MAG: hypothetical protein ACI4GB_03140 [Acutalibacteraceae bacterium]